MACDGLSRRALAAPFDVVVRDGLTSAEGDEPWLVFRDPCPGGWAGQFIEVTYRASLLDEPARPIFRFWLGDGRRIDRIAAAPIAGAGIWIGRVPRETTRIDVSPTNRRGLFAFRIEHARVLSWWRVLARGFRTRPRPARSALLTRLIGWTRESDVNLAWSISSQSMQDYRPWHAVRTRPLDLDDLDRPRFDWADAVLIHIIVLGEDATGLHETLASLSAQAFVGWTALVVADAPGSLPPDPRIEICASTADVLDRIGRYGASLTCVLHCGDILVPSALAYVAEQAHRYPDCRLFYGDALVVSEEGGISPRLQPGWSPRFQSAAGYLAPPLFVRNLQSWPEQDARAFVGTGVAPSTAGLSQTQARPLRRVLLQTTRAASTADAAARPASASPPSLAPGATAAIIIPTRDHPALLRRAITSIRTQTEPGRFKIVVVDNGSTSEDARALLDELAADSDVARLDRPGPFDFSSMCNEAAAATTSEVLVFLNDDTEVLSTRWLERLMAHALDPTIGAVGAKLTYPDGRLQHVGVLVGMGESAGHFGALEPGDAPGWAGRNRVLHEVSAVTGACLAIERAKFDAVGGFDAEHLPVELSDIDLCLKLNARGWQTIVDPDVHLMHEESVSRGGATFRRLDVYGRQRDIFVERWRRVLRDDPFFHPGLSLYNSRAALG